MITIYADGACSGNPGPAASAILMLNSNGETVLTRGFSLGQGTNQTAELHAAHMAINAALDSSEASFTIRCDSQYVVKGVNEWMPGWIENSWRTGAKKPVANLAFWQAIDAALEFARQKGKTITFEWVKGHSNDPHNNAVDKLAVSMARKPEGTTHQDGEIMNTRTEPARKIAPLNTLGLTNDQWEGICEKLFLHARGELGQYMNTFSPEKADVAEIGARRAIQELLRYVEEVKKGI